MYSRGHDEVEEVGRWVSRLSLRARPVGAARDWHGTYSVYLPWTGVSTIPLANCWAECLHQPPAKATDVLGLVAADIVRGPYTQHPARHRRCGHWLGLLCFGCFFSFRVLPVSTNRASVCFELEPNYLRDQ